MKKTTLFLFFLIVLSNLTFAQCIEPKANLEINDNVVFCPGDYTIEDKITI